MADQGLDGLRSRLEEIAEEIASIGYARLQEAIETSSSRAAAQERQLSRARRSVLKAASLLAAADADRSSE
ncbi:MAG: hypothetical protein ACRDZX_13670 [Acidimicrobiales bacterium]